MVNKVLLVVIGGVVLASMAVGGFLGAQLYDGPTATDAPSSSGDGGDTNESGTDTPREPTGTNGTNATGGENGTDDAADGTDERAFPAEEVDAARVEREIVAIVNADVRAKASGDLPALARTDDLDAMARFHSDNMVAQGYPAHAAGGYTTLERYETFDLYDQCRVPDDTRSGVREGRELEVVSRVELSAGDVPGERAIARAIVTGWTDDPDARTKLTYRYAERVGTGVSVTDEGYVYATLDLC
ncbi:CAP domain-containing protein [Halomarina pelagica]|uniref:CAP domain-containing protein n=1 Tax=Halomarina pelagica TaxID=2961599 RepID=UPI0020C2B131|nr:CAP domain-containing protein [Halomarina sp. BND7]